MATLTPEILQELRLIEDRTVTANKKAIAKGIVTRLKKNFALVTGGTLSKNFFYRLGKVTSDYKNRNVVSRCLIFIAVLYVTSEARGEDLIILCEAVFSYLRNLNVKPNELEKDFWDAEKEIAPLLHERREAVAKKDMQTAREKNAAIVRKNQLMPAFLRKTKATQRRRRKRTASK